MEMVRKACSKWASSISGTTDSGQSTGDDFEVLPVGVDAEKAMGDLRQLLTKMDLLAPALPSSRRKELLDTESCQRAVFSLVTDAVTDILKRCLLLDSCLFQF